MLILYEIPLKYRLQPSHVETHKWLGEETGSRFFSFNGVVFRFFPYEKVICWFRRNKNIHPKLIGIISFHIVLL